MSDTQPSPGRAPRFLTDANFNLHIVSGLRRRQPTIDLMTAQQADLLEAPDTEVLLFAKAQDRILLTHDRKTMPDHFNNLLASLTPGDYTPGVMSTEQLLPIGLAIDAILVVWACSSHEEWRDQFVYLPL